jgi:hypothetical protein
MDAVRQSALTLGIGFATLTIVAGTSCGWSDPIRMESVASPDEAVIADWYELSGGGAAGYVADEISLRAATDPFRRKSDYVFAAPGANVIILKGISTENSRSPCREVFQSIR